MKITEPTTLTTPPLVIPIAGPFPGKYGQDNYDCNTGERLSINCICDRNNVKYGTFRTRKKKGEIVINNPRIFRQPERAPTRWEDTDSPKAREKRRKEKQTAGGLSGVAHDKRNYGKGPEDFRMWQKARDDKREKMLKAVADRDREYMEALSGKVKASARSSVW